MSELDVQIPTAFGMFSVIHNSFVCVYALADMLVTLYMNSFGYVV